MRSSKKILLAAVLITFIGLGLSSLAQADDHDPRLFPPNSTPFGMTYGDWSAAWWQYIISIPMDESTNHPLLDDGTVENVCQVGQEEESGPVFFLAGSWAGKVERNCTISNDKAIFFPIINSDCSTVEDEPFYGEDERALRTCAASLADQYIVTDDLKVTVDGKAIHDLDTFRTQSPIATFTAPEDNMFGVAPGPGSLAGDGYYLMLKPLNPGKHVLHFEGTFSGEFGDYSPNITYNLTIVEPEAE